MGREKGEGRREGKAPLLPFAFPFTSCVQEKNPLSPPFTGLQGAKQSRLNDVSLLLPLLLPLLPHAIPLRLLLSASGLSPARITTAARGEAAVPNDGHRKLLGGGIAPRQALASVGGRYKDKFVGTIGCYV